MSDNTSHIQEPRKTKQRHQKPQLRVLLDTNALFVTATSLGSASDLVRSEIADLISEAKYPDLDLHWYIPEIVRHERQYQMQTEALKLRFAINKIERLLSHNLALTDRVLLDHVESKIKETEEQLGLKEIKLDHANVDWAALIQAAAYRLPPFQPGEKEKGFRDALVAESFIQLVNDSPRSPKLCRLVIVTADGLLSAAINARITSLPNVSVIGTIEELKGLINTLISNVDEEFIVSLKPKAAKLFLTPNGDKDSLYVKENIGQRITDEFKQQLAARPEGTSFRSNGQWWISPPNFVRKEQKRVFWASRITIESESENVTVSPERIGTEYMTELLKQPSVPIQAGRLQMSPNPQGLFAAESAFHPLVSAQPSYSPLSIWNYPIVSTQSDILKGLNFSFPAEKRVATHKGRDVYEVLWSTEVTMSRELRKAVIEGIKHIEIDWQPIS
jgi:hypothetical protein